AITTEDADRLQRMADRGSRIVVRLKMDAHFEPDVESANVVGEIRGRDRPGEIVVVSGHLDSWDVGAGATDDGGGCVVTWEALRIMKKLNLRPRRTVRVVLWTNEENGGRGGLAYRDRHRPELASHVMMLESDGGVFRPTGFGCTGSDTARQTGACSTAAQQSKAPAPTDVVATVGTTRITLAQVDEVALQQPAGNFGGAKLSQALYQARRATLEQMVGDALIAQEAAARGMTRE